MTTTGASEEAFLPPFFVYGAAVGFIGVYFFFYLARDVLFPTFGTAALKAKVNGLSKSASLNFYILLPSMVHSLAHVLFHPAWIFFGMSPEHNANRVTYFDDTWPAFFSGVFAGYLLGDFCLFGPKELGPMYVVHHLSASSIWTFSTSLRSMQWYGSFMQFCEFSTIFLSIRQFILTAGYPSSSTPVICANFSLLISFFLVRVLPLPMLVYNWLLTDYSKLYEEKGAAVAIANSVTIVINVVLQTSWFSLMARKALAFLTGKKANNAKNK